MTTMAKKETVQRNWYVLDAAGKPLGRTAVTAAKVLPSGAIFTPPNPHSALRKSLPSLP